MLSSYATEMRALNCLQPQIGHFLDILPGGERKPRGTNGGRRPVTGRFGTKNEELNSSKRQSLGEPIKMHVLMDEQVPLPRVRSGSSKVDVLFFSKEKKSFFKIFFEKSSFFNSAASSILFYYCPPIGQNCRIGPKRNNLTFAVVQVPRRLVWPGITNYLG